MIRFKKIKKNSDDKIHIEFEKFNEMGLWDEFSMKSADEPAPTFEQALDDLAPHVEQVCELPEGDYQAHSYKVRGVSFSYGGEEDVKGVTITVARTLLHSNSPLVLNTPHVIEEPYSPSGDDTQVMSADMLIDINRLEEEAKGYLDGKRAQTDMFAEAL